MDEICQLLMTLKDLPQSQQMYCSLMDKMDSKKAVKVFKKVLVMVQSAYTSTGQSVLHICLIVDTKKGIRDNLY